MNSTEGYCLISLNDELYYKLCMRMINNIRQYDSHRPICIFYDNEEYKNKYFSSNENIEFQLFNSEEIIKKYDFESCKINIQNDLNKYGLFPKLFQVLLSPFEKNIFLDVDMIIKKDFEMFWNYLNQCPYNFLIPGLCDENNRSPSDWHWNRINNVMQLSKLNIPQLSTTMIGYKLNKEEKIKFMIFVKNILIQRQQWGIQEKFRDGIPDEIVFSCYCGMNNIRPNIDLFKYLRHSGMVDMENKNI